jgi:membrane carboxypeptidase/penicillin-binding protein PbpC
VCATITDILSIRHRRPKGWEQLSDSQLPWCMWKTGTSSGHRDAWAVGHNGRYAIGVWVGRFSGAGHVSYVGQEAAEPLLALLFTAPEFRVDTHPNPPSMWSVTRPYVLTQPATAPLKITTPAKGDIFLSTSGPVTIKPATNREADARWFLNGRFLAQGRPQPLQLTPGRYELRCVDVEGHASAVEFAVEGLTK